MFTEDLSVFFNVDDFATAATLQGGAAGGVPVLFDRAYQENFGVAGTRPAALVKASDVVVADVGKTLTIGAETFVIVGWEPQDDGAIVLLHLRVYSPAVDTSAGELIAGEGGEVIAGETGEQVSGEAPSASPKNVAGESGEEIAGEDNVVVSGD